MKIFLFSPLIIATCHYDPSKGMAHVEAHTAHPLHADMWEQLTACQRSSLSPGCHHRAGVVTPWHFDRTWQTRTGIQEWGWR